MLNLCVGVGVGVGVCVLYVCVLCVRVLAMCVRAIHAHAHTQFDRLMDRLKSAMATGQSRFSAYLLYQYKSTSTDN